MTNLNIINPIKHHIEKLIDLGESGVLNRILLKYERGGYKDYLNSDEFLTLLEHRRKTFSDCNKPD